jgi:crotonyl-CoA carboxylase/reductase
MSSIIDIGKQPPQLGQLPDKMYAWVIRPDRHGVPSKAMQLEEIDVPKPGPNEVLVLVKAAGVNYNGVWAALGKPVSPFKYHGQAHHIAGSDASGIVWKVGSNVTRWKPGDEVIIHCNQSCGECPQCNGHDPLACESQRIWGYETTWGSFAQFCKVQAQQLLPKPKHLTWEEAASYGLVLFTAYRMLVTRCQIQAGQVVLVWGAAGGLGTMAIQLCKLYGADAIAVVSSESKAKLALEMGAKAVIDRREFDIAVKDNETEAELQKRIGEMKRFGKRIRELTGGRDPDIVFEHVGSQTFPTSVFVCATFGKIVICGATTGYNLTFDVRYLWMRQKTILGSHFANAYEAHIANQLVIDKKIKPVVEKVFPFEQTPYAHELMLENKHVGKLVIQVGTAREE